MLGLRLGDQVDAIKRDRVFDVEGVKMFLRESVEFLGHMDGQIVDKGAVRVGEVEGV